MTEKDLAYPVLSLDDDDEGYCVFPSVDEFTRATTIGIENAELEAATSFDCNGRSFKIVRAEIVGGIGLFGGWTILGTRHVRVSYELRLIGSQFSLDVLKQRILRAATYFITHGSAAESVKRAEKILSATTYKELFQLLVVGPP